MVRVLPEETHYRIRDPRHFHSAMRSDVTLLHSHRAYVSLTTIIMCCLDALAAGSGKATRGKFEAYIKRHFPGLSEAVERASPGRGGATVLYEAFRNGFAHLRGPKAAFAIAEDHELASNWAERILVGETELVAINIDRLAREFLVLLSRLESSA